MGGVGTQTRNPRPPTMLSLESARQRMLEGLEALPAEVVSLGHALGRVLAVPIHSRLTLPPWDNSAMDGFALRAADATGATAQRPAELQLVGEVAAGHAPGVTVEPGTLVRILTGAPLPMGADTVVPVEDAAEPSGGSGLVRVYRPPVAGAHIRRAGSDLRPDYPLLAAGQELTPAALAVAAAGGHGTLSVHRRPKVAVLATGDELVAAGMELGPAQIPDSNSVGLVAQASELGAEARSLGVAGDRLDEVLERLTPALAWADVIVVSGGVSVGVHDVVKEAFERLGHLDLWRVAVQPGKPLAFARAARRRAGEAAGEVPRDSGGEGPRDSGGEVLLFGLPGNPVSSFVTFELFVRPVLRRLAGHADLTGREVVRARLAEPVSKSSGRRAFLRVRLTRADSSGEWHATLAGGQSSHVLSALAAADGLAIVPEEQDALPEGAEVEVIRLRQGGQS